MKPDNTTSKTNISNKLNPSALRFHLQNFYLRENYNSLKQRLRIPTPTSRTFLYTSSQPSRVYNRKDRQKNKRFKKNKTTLLLNNLSAISAAIITIRILYITLNVHPECKAFSKISHGNYSMPLLVPFTFLYAVFSTLSFSIREIFNENDDCKVVKILKYHGISYKLLHFLLFSTTDITHTYLITSLY